MNESNGDEGCCVSLTREFSQILEKWAEMSLEYQRQSENRLAEAKTLITELSSMFRVQMELGAKLLESTQFNAQNYSELVLNLRKDRDSLRDNLTAAHRELEKFAALTESLQRVLELSARTNSSGVTIGDITANARQNQ